MSSKGITIFARYVEFGIKTWDLDPSTVVLPYLFKEFSVSEENKYWIAFLYRCTYGVPGAWYIYKHFKWDGFDVAKFSKWFSENMSKIAFSHDRWRAKHLTPKAVEKYVEIVSRCGTQISMFNELCDSQNQIDNFKNLWTVLDEIPTFGGVTNFNYCETLNRVMGLNIDTPSMFFSTFHWKPRKGMCYLQYGDTEKNIDPSILEDDAKRAFEDVSGLLPNKMISTFNFLLFGRILCLYAGLALGNRYAGYYWDRQYEELKKVEKYDTEFSEPIWRFRREFVPKHLLAECGGWNGRRKELLDVFRRSDKLVNIDYIPKTLRGI